MMGDEMPMSVAMPSDEAMMLLIYKNYHDHTGLTSMRKRR
jgi:hypothetical protein